MSLYRCTGLSCQTTRLWDCNAPKRLSKNTCQIVLCKLIKCRYVCFMPAKRKHAKRADALPKTPIHHALSQDQQKKHRVFNSCCSNEYRMRCTTCKRDGVWRPCRCLLVSFHSPQCRCPTPATHGSPDPLLAFLWVWQASPRTKGKAKTEGGGAMMGWTGWWCKRRVGLWEA